ncbi:MAG: hypothetical protein B7Z66_15020 [Chromatiales bacterium 21-64-14]|nr:MAG: hypothetical protein B7Z66_15020 [Chromatiales bacterium 21-64-14]
MVQSGKDHLASSVVIFAFLLVMATALSYINSKRPRSTFVGLDVNPSTLCVGPADNNWCLKPNANGQWLDLARNGATADNTDSPTYHFTEDGNMWLNRVTMHEGQPALGGWVADHIGQLQTDVVSLKSSLSTLNGLGASASASASAVKQDVKASQRLCIGNTCVNEAQLMALLARERDSGAGSSVGRYVFISSDVTPDHILNIAEVQVFDQAGKNVSQGKTVTKSSGWQGDQFPGTNLVDGNLNNFAHTSGNTGESPWMKIDLGAPVEVSRIVVFNRVDCCHNRIVGALVQLLDAGQRVVFTSQPLTSAMRQTIEVSMGTGGARLPSAADAAPQGPQAFVLGRYNMGPWNAGNFADKGASWIWNDRNAASNAASGVCINFNKVVHVARMTPVTVHIIADDYSDLRVNGELVGDANGGWGGGNYPKLAATLVPGRNVIQIQARNAGGPAGLIASVISDADGSVIEHTDASWDAGTLCD